MDFLSLLHFALVGFVSLLVVVDPFGLVPIFSGLTAGQTAAQRGDVLRRAVLIALVIALFFLLAGHAALEAIGVSVNAFAISGGILLFVTAFPMLFGHRAGTQSAERGESENAETGVDDDIAVFPLAIPLLSGPGALTSILLLADTAHGDWRRVGALIASVLAVFAVSYAVLRFGTLLLPRIGDRAAHILTRVLGLVTAALAVQYVLNGVTGYCHGLAAGH